MTITREARSDRIRELAPVAALFHSLSDPTRVAIVKRVAVAEARVRDLVDELELAQSTVSAHMACLRDCGLVNGRTQGRSVHYSLSRPEVLDLVTQAEALLAVTGEAGSLCCNYVRSTEQQPLQGSGDE
ncbi:ArsR/SmtB family transcription factor [Brevibacterium ihuae]|uniref:ArsR/SmtB family transcription factor n=1 Tax=Brevibacterium ihuae TaxID=1631743 RepID=UPI000C7925FC|nr:metalloregulator ArsR/SmtB family transcription factor [Brevibacterium ihuae]